MTTQELIDNTGIEDTVVAEEFGYIDHGSKTVETIVMQKEELETENEMLRHQLLGKKAKIKLLKKKVDFMS